MISSQKEFMRKNYSKNYDENYKNNYNNNHNNKITRTTTRTNYHNKNLLSLTREKMLPFYQLSSSKVQALHYQVIAYLNIVKLGESIPSLGTEDVATLLNILD